MISENNSVLARTLAFIIATVVMLLGKPAFPQQGIPGYLPQFPQIESHYGPNMQNIPDACPRCPLGEG